ncbi:MAG: AGE family epimerase/isomerase, partial [Gracilimonas sp.]
MILKQIMNDCESEILNKFSQELEKELTSGILAYWVNNTVDYEKGGFFGRITFNNIPIKDAEKGSVLTARILWAFSASYKMFENTEYEKVAKHAYQYLAEILWDPTYDGVYWMVDADGNPTEDRKHVYAEAFTIYALTEYYSAFKESEALELAKKLYHKIENNCTDAENGGYFEAYSREWELLDDVRLSEKDRNEPKSMNTHLHLLEAYTNLYRHWKSPELKEKLSDLLNIFTRHIMNKDHTSLITFLGKDWTPKSDEIS